MKRIIFLFVILIWIPLSAQSGTMPIAVNAKSYANTSTGLKLAGLLQRAFNKHPLITTVSNGSACALELEILTVSFEDKPMSVYTVNWYVNWLPNPYFDQEYLVSDVGYVGSGRISSTAASIKQRTLKLLTAYQNVLLRMQRYKNAH